MESFLSGYTESEVPSPASHSSRPKRRRTTAPGSASVWLPGQPSWGKGDHLGAVPQALSHGVGKSEDVEHGEEADRGVFILDEVEGGVGHLADVGDQVGVRQHHSLGRTLCSHSIPH